MTKLYFFKGPRYLRYDAQNDSRDKGYDPPGALISDEWPGLPAAGVDAALNWGDGTTFFFAGDQCYRFDCVGNAVAEGYPKDISESFHGLTLDAVDACIKWDLKTAYFFRKKQYWAYDLVNDTVYPNYPRTIKGNWPPVNHPNILKKLSDFGFDDKLDAAVNWGNGKAYFFKGGRYLRYNMDSNREGVEDGWPKDINNQTWPGLFTSGVRAPVMLGYAGFDRSDYPGDALMGELWHNTNLVWCGFYLAPSPSHPGTSWMNKLNTVRDLGWAAVPIYVGQQPSDLPKTAHDASTARGVIDGTEAVTLATNAGFATDTIIYLDIENSPSGSLKKAMKDYYASWVDTVTALGFRPGVYCPFQYVQTLRDLDDTPRFWAVNGTKFPTGNKNIYTTPFPAPEPLLTTVPAASAWQLALDVKFRLNARNITPYDCNSSSYKDPSSIP